MPAARPASTPTSESSITAQLDGSAPMASAAYRNTSGAGFPRSTSWAEKILPSNSSSSPVRPSVKRIFSTGPLEATQRGIADSRDRRGDPFHRLQLRVQGRVAPLAVDVAEVFWEGPTEAALDRKQRVLPAPAHELLHRFLGRHRQPRLGERRGQDPVRDHLRIDQNAVAIEDHELEQAGEDTPERALVGADEAFGAVLTPCYSRAAMRLIITEKNNSAKKIADILSGGEAKADATYKVPFYTWSAPEGEQMTVGLKGHVMGVAFPEGYSNWQETDLHDLIDAELVPEPTDKNVVKAVRKLAKEADSIVIATDFDREGELIGLEALQQALDANPAVADGELAARPPVARARYSALTKDEIERAFSNLDQLAYDLAYAGSARQDIDLIWGATLTRAVSLASRRFGSNFLSVGRVQSPTLALVVERELERRAHVPKPYWELFAKFAHPDGSFEAHHATDKFWEKAEADAALAGTKSPGMVKEVSSRRHTRKPPTPLNTTAFTTDASSRLGITPAAAMRIAEDLYMDGFISYPRTDNTVYPQSLNTKELVTSLVRIPDFDAAKGLLDGPLQATRGKKETTDHPPIYPTQAVYPNALEGPKRRVYELVVRRFLATFSPPMITESTRADIEAGSETYFVRGSVVVDPGYAAIYTYARSSDEEIPALAEGQSLDLEGDPGSSTRRPSRRRGSARAS